MQFHLLDGIPVHVECLFLVPLPCFQVPRKVRIFLLRVFEGQQKRKSSVRAACRERKGKPRLFACQGGFRRKKVTWFQEAEVLTYQNRVPVLQRQYFLLERLDLLELIVLASEVLEPVDILFAIWRSELRLLRCLRRKSTKLHHSAN